MEIKININQVCNYVCSSLEHFHIVPVSKQKRNVKSAADIVIIES